MAQVRVRLQTTGVELVFEGDEAVFERQIEPLLLRLARGRAGTPVRGEAAVSDGGTDGHVEPGPDPATWHPDATSFRTFQRQLVDPPDGPEGHIAAYAFYMWNYEKQETFGSEQMRGCFEADEAPVPEDLDATCAALERRRILQPAAREGTWRLTPRGTNKVRKLLR